MQLLKPADIFNKNAELYQSRFMDISLYADTFDSFCTCLAQNARVLELACGPGNITHYLLDKRPDLKILGTDIAPKMLELAKANNPTAAFELLDCRNVKGLNKSFDAVICGFCLPYLSEIETAKLFINCYQLMEPNGVLYLSTMEENEYHSSGIKTSSQGDRVYMHYHKFTFLEENLLKAGYQISSLFRKHTAADDGTSTIDLIIIAQKPGIVFA